MCVLTLCACADTFGMADTKQPSNNSADGLMRIARILDAAAPVCSADVLSRLCKQHRDTICQQMQLVKSNPSGLNRSPESITEFVKGVSQPVLFRAILRERPQTIAVLLTILPPRMAPKIMRALSVERQTEVINRLSQRPRVDNAVVQAVVEAFRSRVETIRDHVASRHEGVGRIVQILQACDRATEWSVVRALGQDHPELTEEIQQMLFCFDDIDNLSDEEVRILARNVASETWAIALKRASADIRNKVFKNLTPRAAQQVRAEMNYYSQVLPSEIDSSQQRVIEVARQLNQTGQIKRAA